MQGHFQRFGGTLRAVSMRTERVTIRLTAAQIDAAGERAKAAGIPARTWMQRRVVEALEDGVDVAAILRELRRNYVLQSRLWLATAQTPEAREEIMRIVNGVDAATV